MSTGNKAKLEAALQAAQDCLTEATKGNVDYHRIRICLETLAPFARKPDAPQECKLAMAQLFLQEDNYQEAAGQLKDCSLPECPGILREAWFYSGYSCSPNSWASRQEQIWNIFKHYAWKMRSPSAASMNALLALEDEWVSCFPTREVMAMPPAGADKGEICTGLPDGIFSLLPMLFLRRHVPSSVSRDWNITVEAADRSQDECMLIDRYVSAREVRLNILPGKDGKVLLSVYHPYLLQAVREGKRQEAAQSARYSVNIFLPQSARLLYVQDVVLTDRDHPEMHSFPLPQVEAQFRKRNMNTRIPLDEVLQRRRRSYTRKPMQYSRPRTDILHGETCMPELEEIYFLQNTNHLSKLQRYGSAGWFLTIPRAVCQDSFQEFRRALEASACAALGDTITFTGWAEGAENFYIDLVSLSSQDMLRFFQTYCAGIPQGESIRCCTFYWDSILRTFDFQKELQEHESAGSPASAEASVPKSLRAAMEKHFQATIWEEMAGVPTPSLEISTEDITFLDTSESSALPEDDDWDDDSDENPDADGEDPYAEFSELFTLSPDDDDFQVMLKTMVSMFAGRELKRPEENWTIGGPDVSAPKASASASQHVHNTKRKGLSRKKDKRKKKK